LYCKRCHYWLHGNATGRCPECGREFDPHRPRTYLRSLGPSGPFMALTLFAGVTLFLVGIVLGAIGSEASGPSSLHATYWIAIAAVCAAAWLFLWMALRWQAKAFFGCAAPVIAHLLLLIGWAVRVLVLP